MLRSSAGDNLIAETGCFVFYFMFCAEPVQVFKKRFNVFGSPRLKDRLHSRVLYLLDWFDV